VSGGMWRSTDAGQSWVKTTAPHQMHSVSSVVQDKRPGHEITWYFGTGEEFYDFFFKLHQEQLLNISISDTSETSLSQDLNGAYCSISYTSGSAIDSVLHGIPTIAMDPGNFTYEISSHFRNEILNVKKATTEQVNRWLRKLSYHQWSIEEMQNGKAWEYLYPIVKLQTEISRFSDPQDKKKKK
jgi:hypothetical protein